MNPIFVKALQDNNQEVIKHFSKIMAFFVRNEIEDFHVKHLSQAQMKELNPLIRNGIYNALFAIANYQTDLLCQKTVQMYSASIPHYWEDPELAPEFEAVAKQLLANKEKEITFKSDFLNKQYAIGNLFLNKFTQCIEILTSCDFKEVEGDRHRHRDKISAQLRKEDYVFKPGLQGYVKNAFLTGINEEYS